MRGVAESMMIDNQKSAVSSLVFTIFLSSSIGGRRRPHLVHFFSPTLLNANDASRRAVLPESVGIQPAGLRPGDREQQRARRGVCVDDGKGNQEFGGGELDVVAVVDLFFDDLLSSGPQLRRVLRRGRRAPRPARRGRGRHRGAGRSRRRSGVEEGARAEVPRPRREPLGRGSGRGAAASVVFVVGGGRFSFLRSLAPFSLLVKKWMQSSTCVLFLSRSEAGKCGKASFTK